MQQPTEKPLKGYNKFEGKLVVFFFPVRIIFTVDISQSARCMHFKEKCLMQLVD